MNPSARALLVDSLPEDKMRKLVSPTYHSRVTLVSMNVAYLTLPKLQQLVYEAWHVPLSAVDAIHASPPCQYMSRAHHGKKVHYDGVVPVTPAARRDYRVLSHALKLLARISVLHPSVVLSVENPVGKSRHLPIVQRHASLHGWKLIRRADHCMHVNPQFDGSRIFPKKPSSYLLFNVSD